MSEHPPFTTEAPDGFYAQTLDAALEAPGPEVTFATEKLEGRQRRIVAEIDIPCEIDRVWRVLTDYERLADFIPNLTKSQKLPHPQGGIRLEQVGAQCFLNVKFCARVVLDMVERFPQEVGFSMVEGDFRQFEGAWRLEPIQLAGQAGTHLCYDLRLTPPRVMPTGLIEKHFRRDLTLNLKAICDRTLTLSTNG
ncbi:cyclase [filamentous cyanobacterium CCP5]|nr:cyclase [filamentous cyanobacterium CCP5]